MDCVEHAPQLPSDQNITQGRVNYFADSLNDSKVTVNKFARDSGLKSWSANNTGSMHFVSAVHDYGRQLNQSPFRPRAVVFLPRVRATEKRPVSRELSYLIHLTNFVFREE